MRLVNFIVALAALGYGVPAQPSESVSPEEMLRMCNSLAAFATPAVEARQSKIPLAIAVATTATSLQKKLAGVPTETRERYQASVRELYQRVYALRIDDLRLAHQEIVPTCLSYARGQYTAEDLLQMKQCDAKTWPYFGFANLRDMGVSRDQQLEWLKREGLKNAPTSSDERNRMYEDLSDMIEYVYARPDLTKRTIYEERFDSCIEASSD
jgi:hypothetical protein